MTRMSSNREDLRQAIEDTQAEIRDMSHALRIIEKRVQIALMEGARDALLMPALQEIKRLHEKLSRANGSLADALASDEWKK